MRRSHRWLAAAAILVLAAALRLWHLEVRPPHHDEGVNGFFTERVLADGAYAYDPTNFHGPSYFYLLAASRAVFGFGLWQLRLPGALAGVALCLLPLLARKKIGDGPALAAGVVLATSPTLVYFARYAIHETLLAALGVLTAACVLWWSDGGRARWLVAAAAALAGMIATKETTILFVGVGGLWLLGEIAVESVRARRVVVLGHPLAWSRRATGAALAAVAVAAAIHVGFFTGGLRAPGAFTEQLAGSLRAYFVWGKTGTGETGHAKDLCYYLHLGLRYELALYALAAIGLVAGFRSRWLRGFGLVGFGMFAAYSLVAYKMPWLPASWLALLALPAGHGVIVLGRALGREVSSRLGARTALVLATVPALAITVRSSFVRPADRREALAYVHTAPDYNVWFALIEDGGRAVGRERLTIAIDHDATWPLNWSLTRYPHTRWGGSAATEDVIIADVRRAADLEARLERLYLRREFQLRDSAEPAYVYLRRSTFARILAARHTPGFVQVGRHGGPALAARE